MVFRSKIDTWLLCVFVLAAAVALLAAGLVLRRAPGMASLVPIGVIAIGAVLPMWILGSTQYWIVDGALHVRSGPFSWQIPVSSITSIEPSSSLISGPALSVERLRVEYGTGKSVLVSPVDQQAFIRAIESARSAS